MSDKRCGTCRNFQRKTEAGNGTCRLMNPDLGRVLHESYGTGCDAWERDTQRAIDDYARGWRDAVAAAAVLAEECTHGDDMLRGLGRAIAELTPPG